MGTSKSYQAPTTPQWKEHKTKVTISSQSGTVSTSVAKNVLSSYIRANGGSGNIANGNGVVGGGQVAKNVSRRLAKLLQSSMGKDFDEVLRGEGLSDLIGESAKDFILSLSDRLCEDANTNDHIFVRSAILDLLEEMLIDSVDYEDVRNIFENKITNEELGKLLCGFFGYYLYHQFEFVHIEKLKRKRGEKITKAYLKSIKDTIRELLVYKTLDKDITNIDWLGNEGEILMQDIMKKAFRIFEIE